MIVVLVAWALVSAPPPPAVAGWPQADCLSAYGQTACGYHCVSGAGAVGCAKTPYGACAAAYGKVMCADPPRWVLQRDVDPGRMSCLAAFGNIACGYDCASALGQVACARTPQGRCQGAFGNVTCWDPDVMVPDREPRRPPPAPRPEPIARDGATCKSAFGTTACGYDCVAAYGQIRCAQTPAGRCKAAFGDIVCGDPASWAFAEYGGRPPRVECAAAFGRIACGYGCASAFGEVRCAAAPGGRCEAAFGQIVCSD